MAGRKTIIAGKHVEIWATSFRVEGMTRVIRVGHHLNEQIIEDFINFSDDSPHSRSSQGKRPMSMNLNTLAFLVRDDVTTCNVVFKLGANQRYTYKITKALAESLAPQDALVVETCNGLKVAFLYDVHDEPILDPEQTEITFGWAFQRVHNESLARLLETEQVIEEKLRTRRKLSHRQQALAALGIPDPEAFLRELTGPAQE